MELVLKRQLKIERYRVIAEIEKAQKRDEIHAVLLLAQEPSGISAKAIAENLLGGRPETVGKRWLKVCESYNLIEYNKKFKNYVLTDTGKESLNQKKVFPPEQGTWDIWMTDDPLWLGKLVKIEPHEESYAFLEKKDKEKLNKRGKAMKPLPTWIQESLIQQKSVTSLLDAKEDYRFGNLKGKAEKVDEIEFDISLILTIPERGKTSLVFYKGKKPYHHLAPEIKFSDIWQQLLLQRNLLESWDKNENQQVLRVTNDSLKPQEQASFLKEYTFSDPNLEGFGSFEQTTVENVPIAPVSQNDADDWGLELLLQEINRYAVQGEFRKMKNIIRPKFPDFTLNLPEQSELAQTLRDIELHKKHWYLQAPLDWNI
ncbi:hypothetical protein QUF61_17965 [Candidatus Venteria ishoeyi]|uniref:hypothetical protein n=1 Tax=Candidatus Venteria ishoeyi TaxID=1899563 RepID=UPI0025A5C902|nr:hypothetical protein [Candidatus Venteria ishoeyi]MDM8548381.1 hypothetical protein [Candidatus Venteria ishoeyi]